MNRKFCSYLELVRLPGVFTAHADIVAGFLMAGAGWSDLPVLALLMLSTSFFFFAGMALNDFFDYRVDAIERPDRPIPSGQVPLQVALITGIACLGCGLLFAYAARRTSFLIAVLLASAIVAYDGGVKKIPWVAPANMGFCRYLNLLLGFSVLPLNGTSLAIPLLTGVYIFGVTVLSGSESSGKNPLAVIVSSLSIASVFAIYKILFAMGVLPNPAGLYSMLTVILVLSTAVLRLLIRQTPKDYQQTMKWLLVSLIVLDGILVTGVRPFHEALVVWLLIAPGLYVSRKFYMT
ncbi:MAG: UbiA family prenyltransferase [Desulfobacterales bacterium]|jgi:4-hydroxybenzoate polyprenyltransferase|nr:UbiA family prenyltransferase [Desulfobacterales bacterium]